LVKEFHRCNARILNANDHCGAGTIFARCLRDCRRTIRGVFGNGDGKKNEKENVLAARGNNANDSHQRSLCLQMSHCRARTVGRRMRDEPSVRRLPVKNRTAGARHAVWFITSSRRRSRDLWRNARRHD